MRENTLKKIKSLLLNRRQEILKQVAHLEAEREELKEHFIEPIDAAQKEDLMRLVRKLDDRGKEEIEEIDLAMDRMASGTYGKCELCGRSIQSKRLMVLPATRLCRKCAQEYEDNQKERKHHRDEIIGDKLLRDGVGELMALCVKKARAVNPGLECGICGEHAGDPKSISLCHEIGLTYVSCSPYRVPVARLCAALAVLLDKTNPDKPELNIDD